MNEQWYVSRESKPVGPLSRAEVEALWMDGSIDRDTLVWKEGNSTWVALADADLIILSPPPLPSVHPRPPAIPVPAMETAAASSISASPIQVAPATPAIPDAWRESVAPATPVAPAAVPSDGPLSEQSARPPLVVMDDGWQCTRPAPWRRYFARMLDTTLFASMVLIGVVMGLAVFSPASVDAWTGDAGWMNNPVLSSIVATLVMIPISAVMVGFSGTTIGKWIFGVRVTRLDGSAIGFREALDREVEVYVSGLALGIPLVSLYTLVRSMNDLSRDGVTRWDTNKRWVVTHRKRGLIQTLLFVSGVIGIWIVFILIGAFGQS